MTAILRKTAFAVLATLLALLALEAGARIVEWASPPLVASTPLPSPQGEACIPDCLPGLAAYPEHPEGPGIRMVYAPGRDWWVAMPDDASMQFNRLGLRGPELPPKAAGEWRFLTLGDSTVWGHGVADEDVFSSVAARALSARWGVEVRPVIGAQPGHDMAQSLNTLERLGRNIQPDLVLIANLWSDLFHQDSAAFAQPPGQAAPSALYRVLHRALGPLLEPRIVSWLDVERGVGTPGDGRAARTPLPRYIDGLRTLGEMSAEIGARPAFLVLPAPIDLDPAGPPGFVTAYREAMRMVAAELDAPLIEAPEAFRAAGATNAMFFDPVHPSKAGHRLLGEAVAEGLTPLDPAH
ncbi:MAG: SGNH/GDSL hydrolase family protein [Alphaproteobacteria bacterium]|nr:SGNH/GDSL hydrolase family protein [Alphaproteobacteria bacterium]